MTTFSQLVDTLVAELRRPDLKPEVIAYLTQTIREVHFTPDRNNAIFYRENFVESLLVANVDSGFGWDIPDPTSFQALQVVKYPGNCEGQQFPPEVIPSRRLQGLDSFYYRAGSRYNFSGYGFTSSQIALGYFAFPRPLKYFDVASRPATFDPDSGWTYPTVPADPLIPQARVTNWLLMRWSMVLSEGVRAKIYKRVSDADRAKTCYSMYLSQRQGLYTSESADLGAYA